MTFFVCWKYTPSIPNIKKDSFRQTCLSSLSFSHSFLAPICRDTNSWSVSWIKWIYACCAKYSTLRLAMYSVMCSVCDVYAAFVVYYVLYNVLTSRQNTHSVPVTMMAADMTTLIRRLRVMMESLTRRGGCRITSSSTGSTPRLQQEKGQRYTNLAN